AQAQHAEREAVRALDVARPDGALERAAAEIEDRELAAGDVELARDADPRQARFLAAVEQLDVDVVGATRLGEEPAAVARLAEHAGGNDLQRVAVVLAHALDQLAERREPARVGLLADPAARERVLAQPDRSL